MILPRHELGSSALGTAGADDLMGSQDPWRSLVKDSWILKGLSKEFHGRPVYSGLPHHT